jgi:hypothetical protein
MIKMKKVGMAPNRLSVSIPLVLSFCAIISIVSYCMEASHAGPQETNTTPVHSGIASKDAVQQQLIAREKMSWELAIKRDIPSYKALHAPDFFTVGGNGVTDKERSEVSALDPNVSFDRCDLSEFRVDFVGMDAALVIYRVNAAGFDHGKKFDMDSYATSLWVWQDGTWLNVFYQATPATSQ